MHAQNAGQVIKDCEGEVQQKDNVIADLQLQVATISQQISAMHQVYSLGLKGFRLHSLHSRFAVCTTVKDFKVGRTPSV